jgi:hypothetical protein
MERTGFMSPKTQGMRHQHLLINVFLRLGARLPQGLMPDIWVAWRHG